METRELLLIVHILGAFLIAAGALGSTALGVTAGAGTSTHSIQFAAGLQHKLEYLMIVPGAILAIVFGGLLVADSDFIEFSDAWVSASFLLWFIALGLGTGVLGPHAKRVKARADQLIAEGVTDSAELQAEFGAPRAKIIGTVLNISLVVFVYLMVAKPGA